MRHCLSTAAPWFPFLLCSPRVARQGASVTLWHIGADTLARHTLCPRGGVKTRAWNPPHLYACNRPSELTDNYAGITAPGGVASADPLPSAVSQKQQVGDAAVLASKALTLGGDFYM